MEPSHQSTARTLALRAGITYHDLLRDVYEARSLENQRRRLVLAVAQQQRTGATAT